VRGTGPAKNGKETVMRKKTKAYAKGGAARKKMMGGGMAKKKTKGYAKGGAVKRKR
tara:strand:+ start:41 stop:208 length:168 start_codon:yes stop_codon:yes gene_type:complete